jgi:triosephosphate isomerase
MRRPLIAGNWKMNTNITESVRLVQTMLSSLDRIPVVEKVICPPFVSLSEISALIKDTTVKLGAQNMYFRDKGAYTGEISRLMLVDLCSYVILGHSERRQYFFETDEIINEKVKVAFEIGLIPILCIGESLADNEANRTEEIITTQIRHGLAGTNSSKELVIAYEPIWAIGTGRSATGEQANTTIAVIRDTVATIWSGSVAKEVRILYGGSVTAANIAEFVAEPEIDGALVGGASLKSEEFVGIVNQTASIKSAK